MSRVLDASVGFKALVTETNSDKAIRLIDDYRNSVVALIAPDFYPFEVAHSLARAERQGRIKQRQSRRLGLSCRGRPSHVASTDEFSDGIHL